MTEFALYRAGEFVEIRNFGEQQPDIPHKKVAWYPVVREYGDPFTGIEDDNYVIRTVDPATIPPQVPASISDRQFFQQLAVQGIISEQEAENAVATGTIPAAMIALIDLLPPEAQFPARMLLKGATVFERHHTMTATIAILYGWTEGETDDLFREAAAL